MLGAKINNGTAGKSSELEEMTEIKLHVWEE